MMMTTLEATLNRDFSSAENRWEETVTFEIRPAGRRQGGTLDRSQFGAAAGKDFSTLECSLSSWHPSAKEWRASGRKVLWTCGEEALRQAMQDLLLPQQSPRWERRPFLADAAVIRNIFKEPPDPHYLWGRSSTFSPRKPDSQGHSHLGPVRSLYRERGDGAVVTPGLVGLRVKQGQEPGGSP